MRFPDSPLTRRAALVGVIAAAAATPLLATPASAHVASGAEAQRGAGAVFVQLNDPAGNAIAAYRRAADGRLSPRGRYVTGGNGGTAVNAPLDALASQGSLLLDRDGEVLLAVNAGSDSVTSFEVDGARLSRRSVVPSGGAFPVSIDIHDHIAYVLNAGGAGSVSGFRISGSRLVPLPGSTRSLGLSNTNPPLFITAPSQVSFTLDGRFLLVATKANNTLLSFAVLADGRLSSTPVTTASSGPVPFSFVFDARGGVHVTQAGDSTLASYRVGQGGSLVALGTSASTGQAALCWNARIGRTIYGANAGGASLSSWRVEPDGTASLREPIAATTGAGPIDLAASRDGRFLYVQQAIAGSLGVFAVDPTGRLSLLQTVAGLPVFDGNGMEGLAAS